ncbi:protein phosphatase 2C 70 [Cynara cardunculus var. scolymus]|uniref:protein phosphatase 2C 70 n=1 Tax=Cynara cardunculus var. scolymus TaxID=59895 RepID=UPI000D62C7DE|nr:protein phosphatase 2C 70 [Cynara cardunculus var. scolymus]
MAKLPTVAVVDGIVTADGGLLPYLVLLLLLMLLLILIIILIACKPWRVFSRNYRSRTVKATTSSDVLDVERPLVSQDSDIVQSNITEHATNFASEDSCHQNDGHQNSSRTHGLSYKHKLPPTPSHFSHDGSLILDISDEDVVVGQTLKRPSLANDSVGEQKYSTKEDLSYKSGIRLENDSSKQFMSRSTADQRSILTLKVISGPSSGAHYSIQSTNKSKLPLTLGRVSPSDVLVTDSEVSGKHAMINWNLNKLKWELVDMGSLNGTLLNSKTVHHPQTGSRHWGDPVELTSGDIITVGTTSKISVQITSQFHKVPFGVGVVSDPMSVRKGGKKLPMEDVCYYHWPLPGVDQFGLFGICDGHGGAAAASFASKIMPEMVTRILSDTFRREKVFSHCDASDVLREAFSQTEAHMDHLYEGCTATVLLIWADGHDNYFAQCANVGDSACIAIVEGQQVKITEDHRIASYTERLRMQAAGEPLKDGEKRLCGLNLARMLGDKYLKQQDARFSSEPYISQVVYMKSESRDFAIMASDGFWDVVNPKKAIQLVHQIRERNCDDASAENIAKLLLSEARAQRTKDNTSIIFLDFDTNHHHDMMMDHEA